MGTIKLYWSYLRASLWFIPLLMVLGWIGVALGLIEADARAHWQLAQRWPRLFAAEPQGSQAMLAAIATSMVTVAGVVFSITIVALAQASNQYSPRVLRNFMRDRSNQVVLGFFVGAFAYCLVVLRNITWENEPRAVPSLAIFVAFLLALTAIGFLIYFIHHIASSIQASTMIHAITAETLEVIEEMFPHKLSEPDLSAAAEPPQGGFDHAEAGLAHAQWHIIPALSFGYVQRVEKERLLKLACQRRLTIRMELGVGEFALQGRPLVRVCGGRQPDRQLIREINRNYGIDAHRTVEQDPGFGIQQLVDIAAKGLSPGINDTTTATTAVDYLSAIFCELAVRRLEPSHYFDGPELKIIAHNLSFDSLFTQAFERLIECAHGNQAMMRHLLAALARIAEATCEPRRRQALHKQAGSLVELARTLSNSTVRREIEREALRVLNQCGREPMQTEGAQPSRQAA